MDEVVIVGNPWVLLFLVGLCLFGAWLDERRRR